MRAGARRGGVGQGGRGGAGRGGAGRGGAGQGRACASRGLREGREEEGVLPAGRELFWRHREAQSWDVVTGAGTAPASCLHSNQPGRSSTAAAPRARPP